MLKYKSYSYIYFIKISKDFTEKWHVNRDPEENVFSKSKYY